MKKKVIALIAIILLFVFLGTLALGPNEKQETTTAHSAHQNGVIHNKTQSDQPCHTSDVPKPHPSVDDDDSSVPESSGITNSPQTDHLAGSDQPCHTSDVPKPHPSVDDDDSSVPESSGITNSPQTDHFSTHDSGAHVYYGPERRKPRSASCLPESAFRPYLSFHDYQIKIKALKGIYYMNKALEKEWAKPESFPELRIHIDDNGDELLRSTSLANMYRLLVLSPSVSWLKPEVFQDQPGTVVGETFSEHIDMPE